MLDRKILVILSENARQSATKISKQVRCSKDRALYRIKRLEESGIIRGYRAVVNYGMLGYSNHKIYLKLTELGVVNEDKIIKYFTNIPCVSWITSVSEDYDIVINLTVKTVQEVMHVLQEFSKKYGTMVSKKNFAVTHRIQHFNANHLLDKVSTRTFCVGDNGSITLSENEINVLEQVANHGKIGIKELAVHLHRQINSTLYSLQSLEKKGIIKGYVPLIDYEKLGFSHYKVMLVLSDASKYREIFERVSREKNILYITELLGEQDIEFEIICKNQQELVARIKNLRESCSGLISDVRTRLLVRTHEVRYVPSSLQ